MGVIRRQSIKHSIVSFAGLGIGMINVLFIYTLTLSKVELGLVRFLAASAFLILPFIMLGIGVVSVKYYPQFKNQANGNNGFLFFLLSVPIIAFLFLLIGIYFFKMSIIAFFSDQADNEFFLKYLPFILPIALAISLAELLSSYISNFQRIAIPAVLYDLFLKIALPILCLLYYWTYLNFNQVVIGFMIAYLIVPLSLLSYLWFLGELHLKPNFQFLNTQLLKSISNFSTYSFLSTLGVKIATRIDIYMVTTLIDLSNAGIYSIALFIASVVDIPLKSIARILGPFVAESFRNNDLMKLGKLYKSASLNLLVIGVLILCGIWGSIDYLFDFIPNGDEYRPGKYVILFLGLSKLFDMSTSINSHIISYSSLYRFNLWISLILAFLNIIFNIIFIPIFGLLGVALATLSSIIIYNLIKVVFVWVKFKIQPFTWNMLLALVFGLLAYISTCILPDTNISLIDIIINSVLILLIYIPSVC